MNHDEQAASAMADDMRVHCLGVRVERAHRLLSRTFEQALRPLGVTMPQLELLSTLTMVAAAIRPAALADLTGVERSTMSRNLAVLHQKGWIATAETSPTGRSMAVAITAAGTALLAAARPAWEGAQRQALAALGTDAAGTLDQWIRRLGAPPQTDPPQS